MFGGERQWRMQQRRKVVDSISLFALAGILLRSAEIHRLWLFRLNRPTLPTRKNVVQLAMK